MLHQEDLQQYPTQLEEITSAGEPLNPEIFFHVKKAWGKPIREIYGLTEITAAIGYPPGLEEKIIPGTMGVPLPGYQIELMKDGEFTTNEGEIVVKVNSGLMQGYQDKQQTERAIRNGYFHTNDWASRTGNQFTFFSREGDIIVKTSGYQVSPFEVESELLKHAQVVESAVVGSPHSIKGNLIKAVVVVKENIELLDTQSASELAKNILNFVNLKLAHYAKISIIEFQKELPKTISGKIIRKDLTKEEKQRIEHQSPKPALLFYASEIQESNTNVRSMKM